MSTLRFSEFVAESDSKKEYPRDYITLYADAGFKDGEGTYGVWARADNGRQTWSGACPPEIDDNTLAEVYAICQGMHKALKRWPSTKGFYVRTDSQAAINILQKGGNGKKEVTGRLYAAYRKMVDDGGLDVRFRWVKGHQGTHTTKGWINNKVDQMATAQRNNKNTK